MVVTNCENAGVSQLCFSDEIHDFHADNEPVLNSFRKLLSSNSASVPPVAGLIARALQRAVAADEASHGGKNVHASAFHGYKAPNIQLLPYLERIVKYTKCSPICLVYAYHYVQSVSQKCPSLRVCKLSVHRLIITGILVAVKLLDDHFYNNSFYAKVGGVSLQEMNHMELELLKLLDFRMNVSLGDLRTCLQDLSTSPRTSFDNHASVHAVVRKRRSVAIYECDQAAAHAAHWATGLEPGHQELVSA